MCLRYYAWEILIRFGLNPYNWCKWAWYFFPALSRRFVSKTTVTLLEQQVLLSVARGVGIALYLEGKKTRQ